MVEEMTKRLAANCRARPILVEIAPGELIDKITILEIKNERISDSAKLRNIRAEFETLQAVKHREIAQTKEIALLTSKLKAVNRRLWEVEDEIRLCEKVNEFGPRFIELARSVYQQNDRRSAIKRRINELLGSLIFEEKLYPSYG